MVWISRFSRIAWFVWLARSSSWCFGIFCTWLVWIYWWYFTDILCSNFYNLILFFCDCLSSSINFFRVFDLHSSFCFSWSTFLDYISLTSFKIWIFSNDDIVSFFAFVGKFAISLRTIFYDLVLWFSSFFSNFKLTSFLIESSCVFYRSLRTFFDNFFFTSFKFWVVSVFSVVSKLSFFYNWFNTDSYNSVFFFCYSLCSFCSFTNWFRIFYLLSNCNFFLTRFSFIFDFLETGFKGFIIDYLSFVRNFSFDSLSSFPFSRLSTNLDQSFLRLFRSLKLAFFSFNYLTILDNKSICSFLLSWRTWSYNFFFARFEGVVVFISCFKRKFFLFYDFMSTVVCTFTN